MTGWVSTLKRNLNEVNQLQRRPPLLLYREAKRDMESIFGKCSLAAEHRSSISQSQLAVRLICLNLCCWHLVSRKEKRKLNDLETIILDSIKFYFRYLIAEGTLVFIIQELWFDVLFCNGLSLAGWKVDCVDSLQLRLFFSGVMASTKAISVFLVLINAMTLAEKKREYKLGLLIPFKTVIPRFSNDYNRGESFAAAMTIAVERLNAHPTLLPEHNLTFVWKDTICNELVAVREQLNQINSGVQAFIGPGCNCQTAARNAAAFNMTMLSYVSMQTFCGCCVGLIAGYKLVLCVLL